MITVSVDEDTGLMTVSVSAGEAQLASELVKSFLAHFKTRVREIRTKKTRKRLSFLEERFREAEQELETAEDRLAKFLEQNQNPTTPTLQFRRDRLQQQVRFKEQVYSDLQGQLTQARLSLQRQTPVVTSVEKPVPPLERSFPQRTIIVVLAFLLGGVFSIGFAFLKSYLEEQEKKSDEGSKIREIKDHLSLSFKMHKSRKE